MTKNAVLYIRVSTDEQAKYGYSIDMQQNQCFNFATKEGYTVIRSYIDDGYTAKNTNRPRFQELLNDIKKASNHIDAVIVWRCDRMVRNNGDYHSTIVPKFQRYGVALLSATENNDVNNPYGRYIRNTQINNAELESELTSIRTRENLREKARQGYYPGAIPPVGYIRKTENGKKLIVPNELEAPFIKDVFELYTRGGFSYKEIAERLAARGFSHNNKPCSKKLIENILTVYDIFYIGKFKFNGEIYNGKHTPLISLELYAQFKAARTQNYTPRKSKHTFLYKGLITCPKTNRMLVGERQTGRHNSGIYEYYRCHHACEFCKDCKRILKAETIDKAVLDALEAIEITPETFQEYKGALKYIMFQNQELNDKRKQYLNEQITRLDNRLLALYDDKIDGVISQDVYIKKRDTWQNKIEEFTIELAALNKTQGEVFKRIDLMLELLKDTRGAYLQHSIEKKQYLLKLLCSNLFYDGSKIVITIKEPFKALLKFAIFNNGAGYGSLLEPYKNVLYPIFNSAETILLCEAIRKYKEIA